MYYLKFTTGAVEVTAKGPEKSFYAHTANAYKGGLFPNGTPEGFDSSVDTSHPVPIPEQTGIIINVMAHDSNSHVSVGVRNTKQEDNRLTKAIISTKVNFGSRIGVVLVDVQCDDERFTFTMDVCPTKIGYDNEYYELIDDLQAISRELAFDWLRSSSLAGSRNGTDKPSDIEFLNALDDELKRLKTNLTIINRSPSRTIARIDSIARLDGLGAPTQQLIRAMAQGKGSGPVYDLNGVHVHERIPSMTSIIGYDTPANRWLKQQLDNNRNRIGRILRNNKQSLYAEGTRERLRYLYTELTTMLNQPFLRDVRTGRGYTKPNMEVLGRNGYRETAQIFNDLEKAFTITEGIQLINSRLIAELYEEWCYLKVATLVSEITNGAIDPRQSIDITNGNLRIRFGKNGRSRMIITANENDEYSVAYNKEYKTITGVQKPDIVIEINTGHSNPTILVLDAKYRLTDHDDYGRAIAPQPPVDAINALHRYRDAIYIAPQNRSVRPVVKCVILYPPSPQQDMNNLPYWESISQVGIGAIPLKPKNDDLLRQYLSHALDVNQLDFYKPGPSFEPYESILLQH